MSTKREYCGVGKVPKGAVRGSAKQCAEQGQVRYWGIKKIDPRTLAAAKDPTITKDSEMKLKIQYSAGLGSKKQLEKYIATQEKRVEVGTATETDKEKLAESKKELVKVNKVLEATKKKILELEAAKKKAILAITPAQAVKAIPLKDRKQIIKDAVTRKGTKKKTPEQVAAYKEATKALKAVKAVKVKEPKAPAGRKGTKKVTVKKEAKKKVVTEGKARPAKKTTKPKKETPAKATTKATKSGVAVKPKFSPDGLTGGRPMIVLDPHDNKTLWIQILQDYDRGWRKFDNTGFTEWEWENVADLIDLFSSQDSVTKRNLVELIAVDEKTLNAFVKFMKTKHLSIPRSMESNPEDHILKSKLNRGIILEALKKKATEEKFDEISNKAFENEEEEDE